MTGKIEQWILENQIIEAEPCTYNVAEILPWAKEWDAEIEALQRRVAEMTDALDNVLYYQHRLPEWLADKVHAALTPTESEAK